MQELERLVIGNSNGSLAIGSLFDELAELKTRGVIKPLI